MSRTSLALVIGPLVIGILAVAHGAAHADPADPANPDDVYDGGDLGLASGHDLLDPDEPPHTPPIPPRWRWDLGFALENGATGLHSSVDLQGGAALQVGLRYDRVALLASYSLFGIGDGGCPRGETLRMCQEGASEPGGEAIEQRVGVDLRVTAYRGHLMLKGKHERVAKPAPAELYVEAGAGREWISWTAAGVPDASRDDLGFGVGIETPVIGPTHHAIGHIGLRAMLAQGEPTLMLTVGAAFGN